MATTDLRTYARRVARSVIEADAGRAVGSNDILGADLGYNAGGVLQLIGRVEGRLNQNPPDGLGPFWLPKGQEQTSLTGAPVGGFQDWVYHQCQSSKRAGVAPVGVKITRPPVRAGA
jgi:hypothetical protein